VAGPGYSSVQLAVRDNLGTIDYLSQTISVTGQYQYPFSAFVGVDFTKVVYFQILASGGADRTLSFRHVSASSGAAFTLLYDVWQPLTRRRGRDVGRRDFDFAREHGPALLSHRESHDVDVRARTAVERGDVHRRVRRVRTTRPPALARRRQPVGRVGWARELGERGRLGGLSRAMDGRREPLGRGHDTPRSNPLIVLRRLHREGP
jgi:hypothetical protein